MKPLYRILSVFLMAILIAACAPHKHPPRHPKPPHAKHDRINKDKRHGKDAKHHAPGQVKKRHGEKSAKRHAPGQVKKRRH